MKKSLLFGVLLGLHLLLSHASFSLYHAVNSQPPAERSARWEALARAGVEVTWRPLLFTVGEVRIGGQRLADVHRNFCIAVNSTAAVTLAFVIWWWITRFLQVLFSGRRRC